ncbi:MAG: glycosyltransferase family 2 protein [Thomasclavelia sp.]
MYYAILMSLLLIIFFIMAKVTKYRQFLIGFNIIICIIYIIWRLTAIPVDHGILSFIFGLMLYLAELLGLISFFNFQYLFWGKYHYPKKTLAEFKDSEIPFVDILICTYNEPIELLEMTILAAMDIDYPSDCYAIYVCDDGRRENLKMLCNQYQINYLTRQDNQGAKAGNINNALKYTHGKLFTVLDADMIPTRNFLKHTVGYFSNPNLAFVQTPQVYYNQDMYQYNLSKHIPNEQDFFMRDIQEARAARNAVLHVGTNAVFKKEYVLAIGGYPTCSITEDMAVGMQLQANGYDSLLINEELVYGLSAMTFADLVKQRDRWCRGNLQVLKHYNPIFNKGLSFSQKIAYLDGAIYWFANLQKMVFLISPLIYLLTGIPVLDCDIEKLIMIYLPYFLGQILIFKTLSPKTRNLKWAHYYETIMAPHLSLSILKELLNIKIKFNVTSKNTRHEKKNFQFKMVIPHLIILILTIISWKITITHLIAHEAYMSSYMLNIIWSSYNLMAIVLALRVAWQKPIFRNAERILINKEYKVYLKDQETYIQAKLIDISNLGAQLKVLKPANLNTRDVYLCIDEIEIPATIMRINDSNIGLKYIKLDTNSKKKIMRIIVDNLKPYYQISRNK